MPVRGKKKYKIKKVKKDRNFNKFLFPVVLVVGLVFTYYFSTTLQTSYWRGEEKISVAIRMDGGDVLISTFDPIGEQVHNILIPKDTEMEAARQLGVWKIRSVWDLGKNENLGGDLLSESITHHFRIPVKNWSDYGGLGLATGGFVELVKSALLPYDTNLSKLDRIRLALFSFRVKNKDRIDIDLSKSKYLKLTKLKDGSEGYKLVMDLPESIKIIFSDRNIASDINTISIINSSGSNSSAKIVGDVAEVLGAKVASINLQDQKAFDCVVWGNNQYLIDKLAKFFECTYVDRLGGPYDAVLEIGEEFSKRF